MSVGLPAGAFGPHAHLQLARDRGDFEERELTVLDLTDRETEVQVLVAAP